MLMTEGSMLKRESRSGFTLVEILIVVVLLGILGSIVLAQFGGTTLTTRKAALSDQLHGLRTQIQMYAVQHETTPTLNGANWDDMINQTADLKGQPRGPYLHAIPQNILNKFSNVAVVGTDPKFGDPVDGANIGFVYNSNNGFIWGTNSTGTKVYNEADPDDPNN
jgi:prepilin-type N-terminal cleavage/methylation domain-containing protein